MNDTLLLIGLPGSGKTTVGGYIADRLGLPFTDCDTAIQQAEGMRIPAIFAEKGEPYFRAAEHRILAKLYKSRGQVIATGGGVVVAEENRKMLRSSGFVVFLDRDIQDIAACVGNRERPLLRRYTLEELAEQRRGWYLECADAVVCRGTAEELAEQIIQLWRERI